jgi:hypothetical protein
MQISLVNYLSYYRYIYTVVLYVLSGNMWFLYTVLLLCEHTEIRFGTGRPKAATCDCGISFQREI